ncbi:hypothetical protein EDB85DRAFT_1984794 [Lactarius pseudohatsudake]|nr:hypothetical protein EDB85DRAFT_1984794 [Lactarius pseudohatsudake]
MRVFTSSLDTVVELTIDDAKCNGVFLHLSRAAISAPCSISSRTVSALPESAARCKGVEWISSCAVTSAP